MDGIQLMATAMHAAQARLDVSASNLANVSTAGFHKRVAQATLTSRGLVATSRRDAAQGPLSHTGRSFDLAVVGAGGFFVRTPAGAAVESRSGSFERNARGELSDSSGRVLLGVQGPVIVPPDATIDPRGIVRDAGIEVARIRVRPGVELQSGFLEGANVDAVHEMVDVLGAQRAFETAQKTLVAIDDTRQKAVNDVARVK
jgi:flagellar basal-body rod protein FlgF